MLPKFELVRARDLGEVLQILAELGEGAKLFAGGTDLLVQMRAGRLKPQCLIDIKGLDDLKGITGTREGGLNIGSLTTHREIECSSVVRERTPILYDGASKIGSVQIRNRATVGGNICNALPSADNVGPLIALGARLCVLGPHGQREIALEEFFLGPRKTLLAPDEILLQFYVPPVTGQGAYIKYSPRKAMDLAMLGVSVYLALDSSGLCETTRIALTTAAPVPMRAREAEAYLIGKAPNDDALRVAGEIASREARPRSSWRSSESYRRELIKVLVPRAGRAARERLGDIRP